MPKAECLILKVLKYLISEGFEIKFSNCLFKLDSLAKIREEENDDDEDYLTTSLKSITPMGKIFQYLLPLVVRTLCSLPKLSNFCTQRITEIPGSRTM